MAVSEWDPDPAGTGADGSDADVHVAPDAGHLRSAVLPEQHVNLLATSRHDQLRGRASLIVLSPQDTSLNLNATNFSTEPLLLTYTWPDNQVANAILMTFDLSGLPAGAVVHQATLQLALVEADGAVEATYIVAAHKIVNANPVIADATGYTADGITPWTANACCSDNVPLAQADISAPYDAPAIDKTIGFKFWTITAMVQEWLSNPAGNRGLLLNSDASKLRDRYRNFASDDHPDSNVRPSLRVTYTLGP